MRPANIKWSLSSLLLSSARCDDIKLVADYFSLIKKHFALTCAKLRAMFQRWKSLLGVQDLAIANWNLWIDSPSYTDLRTIKPLCAHMLMKWEFHDLAIGIFCAMASLVTYWNSDIMRMVYFHWIDYSNILLSALIKCLTFKFAQLDVHAVAHVWTLVLKMYILIIKCSFWDLDLEKLREFAPSCLIRT